MKKISIKKIEECISNTKNKLSRDLRLNVKMKEGDLLIANELLKLFEDMILKELRDSLKEKEKVEQQPQTKWPKYL
jgi:hypothetical protein